MGTPGNKGMTRRRFLLNVAGSACGSLLLGAALYGYSRQTGAMPAQKIRPPGALDEVAFLGACLRCGQCVRDCPYDSLHLAGLGEAVPVGTPYFVAREEPCRMCVDIPCVKACPTGALDHALTDINQARMGLAVVVDEENCLAFRGMRCEACFNICPVQGRAIKIELLPDPNNARLPRFVPVVYAQDCTGCGMCEMACILQEAAIKVLPHQLARGKAQPHDRYELQGEPRIEQDTGQDSPFSDNPLETLQRGAGGS